MRGLRAALYARVSTPEGTDQNPETQLVALREYASGEGLAYKEYVDHASGRDLNRPAWQQMMVDINAGRVDLVVVLRIDRAFRSVLDGATTLAHLDALGVRFLPLAERAFDTGTPGGKAMIQISLVWAELERALIGARVREGQHRARLEGRKPGRRRLPLSSTRARRALADAGGSEAAAARALGVDRATLRRRLGK